MLVLSRRPSEELCFPDLGISVKVLECGQKRVRIGVDAPRSVRVLRRELQEDRAPLRVLLVEDNPNEARLLAGYLKCRNFDVCVAHDGAEALERLQYEVRPDVVLLDMFMPGCDGGWTISEIRKDDRLHDLPVFAVSGGSPSDAGVDVGPAGVDLWLSKPLDPESLVSHVAAYTISHAAPR